MAYKTPNIDPMANEGIRFTGSYGQNSFTTGRTALLRYSDWRIQFTGQHAHGGDVWIEPYVLLRVPQFTNLRGDKASAIMTNVNI